MGGWWDEPVREEAGEPLPSPERPKERAPLQHGDSEPCRTPALESPVQLLGSVGMRANLRCFLETGSNSRGWEMGLPWPCGYRWPSPRQEGSSLGVQGWRFEGWSLLMCQRDSRRGTPALGWLAS